MDDAGAFLRSRRELVDPSDAGLPQLPNRRVKGLRREELAVLAGVSVDYYTRLEQGRARNPSAAVIDALAHALRLAADGEEHLRNLLGTERATRGRRIQRQVLRPSVRRLLEAMDRVPAFVLGRRMDVLAWNELGGAANGFDAAVPSRSNAARFVFTDPAARGWYPEWEAVAAETVAHLRLDAGRHPHDDALGALVAELAQANEDFGSLWAEQHVREKTAGRKLIDHPVVGPLDLQYETMAVAGDADQLLVTYTCAPGSPTEERLQLLASWAATDGRTGDHRSRPARPARPQG